LVVLGIEINCLFIPVVIFLVFAMMHDFFIGS
jgi:hypothetical protein